MSDVFYTTGKIAWLLISPELWPIYALVIAAILKRWTIIWVVAICLGLLAFVPIGSILLKPLETRFAQPDLKQVDGIIILGGAQDPRVSRIWGQPVLNNSSERYFAGLALANAYPKSKVVFTGRGENFWSYEPRDGLTKHIRALEPLGKNRYLREGNSRSTFENAIFSKNRVAPSEDQTWLLVTSAWHMPRAVGVFCAVGWNVTPYPVDYRSGHRVRRAVSLGKHLSELGLASKEWVGLLAYRLSNKTNAFFPKGC